jgi:hypothetical protein
MPQFMPQAMQEPAFELRVQRPRATLQERLANMFRAGAYGESGRIRHVYNQSNVRGSPSSIVRE